MQDRPSVTSRENVNPAHKSQNNFQKAWVLTHKSGFSSSAVKSKLFGFICLFYFSL